jgi:hypothetical protein
VDQPSPLSWLSLNLSLGFAVVALECGITKVTLGVEYPDIHSVNSHTLTALSHTITPFDIFDLLHDVHLAYNPGHIPSAFFR